MSLFQVDAGREWRGGQRQVFLLTRELAGRGYPVTLVAPALSPLREKAEAAGLRVLPIGIRGEADFAAGRNIARAMRRENCVLAHFHDGHAAGVGGRAARRAGVPIRIISRRVEFPLGSNPFSRRKYAGVDAVVAISERVRAVLRRGGVPDERIEVIPSGIDLSPFRDPVDRDSIRGGLGFGREDFLAGIVAHLDSGKGHRTLIEAAGLLKSRLPRLKVVVIGGGPLRAALAGEAGAAGIGDRVSFLGFREDVPRLLRALDLFVLPSVSEGLGTSIMDAMAARLPVAAASAGGIPEVVVDGETGLLVPPLRPGELAEAIFKIAGDPALARRFGERGFVVVREKFSAEEMASRTADLYERIARAKNVRLKP